MKNAFLVLAVLATLAVLTMLGGCSDTCHSTCEKHNQCDGAFHQLCDAVCNASADTASHINCTSTYDALQTCLGDPAPPATICMDDPARCSMQQTAYTECQTTYCTAHPDEPACRTPTP